MIHIHLNISPYSFACAAAFGVDAVFSYKYNQQLGICSNDGLAIYSGFNTSHVIPVCYLKLDA